MGKLFKVEARDFRHHVINRRFERGLGLPRNLVGPFIQRVQYGVARCESLEELFSQNEIIVELAGRTASTQGIVNEELLRMLPEGAVFVNSGRGAVVDEEALIKLVEEGHLHLGLDVFAKEPLPADSPLRGNENVFLTPHIAGPTADQLYVCGLHALQNASAYFRGEQLESRLTLTHYDCMT